MALQSHRRELFRPRTLGQAIKKELSPDTLPSQTKSSMLQVGRRAMACEFEMMLPAIAADGIEAAQAALDEIDRLEDQLSVYRPSSEVSRLNELAAYSSVPMESGLFSLLSLSARLYGETERAFDITAGALIKAWGFFRGPKRVPSQDEITGALEKVGMNQVRLNPEELSAKYEAPGLEINLGSIGKGYALDRAGQVLARRWRQPSALLHGGYSSVLALGYPPGDRWGWTVGICDPRDSRQRLATVRLRNRALGTSSASFQHLEYEGRRLGHILDPRSGWPAGGVLSASVLAPCAAEADALATAAFILGVDWIREYCKKRAEIGAIMVPFDEDAGSPNVLRFGRLEL